MDRSLKCIIEKKKKIGEPKNMILFMKIEKRANENVWLYSICRHI